MPPYAGVLKESELQSILAYVHSADPNTIATTADTGYTTPLKDLYLNTTGYITWKDPSGNPAITPPWGRLHALDLSTGEYIWQLPLGNETKLQINGEPETGTEGKSGPVVTAGGLIFIAGSQDKKLWALNKTTGKILWQYDLPAIANATVATYWINGKQYVALSVGGTKENPSGSIMAFALP